MQLEQMLAPDAAIPTTPKNIQTLVQEVRRLRRESDMEALSFYTFTAALVAKVGGQVELSPDEMKAAQTRQLEIADTPDGGQIARIAAPPAGPLILTHRPTIVPAHH